MTISLAYKAIELGIYCTPIATRPIEDLMLMQSKGQYLTPQEKNLVSIEATKRRKKNNPKT